MVSFLAAPDGSVARRIEQASGIRPITLLIAFGIVLITGILIATGLAANQLREQALSRTEIELGRIDSILVAATGRLLNTVDGRLADVADDLRQAASGNPTALRAVATALPTPVLLHKKLGRFPAIAAIGVIAADGEVIARAGTWPETEAAAAWRALIGESPEGASTIGAPIANPRTGASVIPLAHRIDGSEGKPAGAVVGLIPTAAFANLFATATLPDDAVIGLLRPDGVMLARYPEKRGATLPPTREADFAKVFGDSAATMVRFVLASTGEGRIEALRTLADYPVAVTVSRSTDQALAGWAHQGLWFGAFALLVAVAIGIMVYLIARQFQTHAALATIRAEQAIALIDAEKVEIERARLAAEAELLKSERLSVLGQLTATVAHELRNPLSAIRNSLFTVNELAQRAGLKLDRPVGRMERSIERCDRIISDLLEYTRNRELNCVAVRFDHWIADVLAEQNLAPDVVLATELGAADTVVGIDADRIRRVIINLVENAAQALAELPPDGTKRITVRTTVADAELVLAIEDTGPGMAPKTLDRIFEPLFSTKSFGTGLGLPTVKQIVNQHGGVIDVDSEVGSGTRVTVRLPVEAAAMPDIKVAA
jgi:signal transduction histidine kinase